MNSLLLILLLAPVALLAQNDDPKRWTFAPSFSFGSENNSENYGLMLSNEIGYNFASRFSVSANVSFFHSFPWLNDREPDYYRSYSSFFAGFRMSYSPFKTTKFFTKASIGLDYVHTHDVQAQGLFIINANAQSVLYDRAIISKSNELGYYISVEGGWKLSNTVSLGPIIQIYSYQIFGDIITLGPKVHIKL